jgi:membrane-associated phospholipid phosphatase
MTATRAKGSEPRVPSGEASRGPLRSTVPAPAGAATLTVLVGFLGLVGCLILLGSLAEDIRSQEVNALDTLATPFLHGLASPALDTVMTFITTLGSNLVIPPLFVLTVAWLAWLRRPREGLFLAITSGGSLVINETMKLFFQRPRPHLPWAQVPPDYSFPSGHTMNSLVFYVALAVVLWSVAGRRVGIVAVTVAIVLSCLVGLSRIYLGAHYFTDVAGGLLAGTVWLLVVAAAFRFGPLWQMWRDPPSLPSADSIKSKGKKR